MMELQHENKISEMRELLFDLQDKNQQIELEKQQLVRTKEKQILDLSSQVKQLEQQLISANLEIANVRSQLHIEEQLVSKLKKEKEFVTQSETFGGIKPNSAEHELEDPGIQGN